MAEVLILLDSRGRKHVVPLSEATVRVHELGTFDTQKLRDHVGRRINVGNRGFLVLLPSTQDFWEAMDRGPQVLVQKDIAAIVRGIDLGAGARVAEAGCGSGSLTVTLGRAVGPQGRVYSFDIRDDSLERARANVARANLEAVVDFQRQDVRTGFPVTGLDAVVLDLPDPWEAIPAAWEALRPCGYFASFSPNMEQIKSTHTTLRRTRFVDLRTIEVIEREMEVRDVGVRPSFAPLGHTGYLTFARKVLDTF